MDIKTLCHRAQALVDRLTSGINDHYGKGFMSAAVYDTAWVSMVSKSIGSERIWLFPSCFKYLLDQQQFDGSWTSYASQIDGILNTAASLLSLARHCSAPLQIQDVSVGELADRIKRATSALQALLDNWDIDATIHVGFEILVPALLEYLQAEDIVLDFPGKERLMQINAKKVSKLKPEYLYGKIQLTALHSLEAFIGKIEFDRVRHHKVNGSFMASPSSTAAVLMNISTWDDECEDYLRHVIAYGAGQRTGGVPSAFPSTIFELTWAVSTLLESGFDLASIATYHSEKLSAFLGKSLDEGGGAVGFAPGLSADADDTSKTILILNLLGYPTSAHPLLHGFEADHYFKTYPLERDPSFSANCNVLIALLHVPDPSTYTVQIEKVTRFLLIKWRDEGFSMRDKWNISPFYSLMLMAQGMSRLIKVIDEGRLPEFSNDLRPQITGLLVEVARYVIQAPSHNGSWGCHDSKEETAYAILALASSLGNHTSREFDELAMLVIARGRDFLITEGTNKADYLWVEKVTYASEILLESYVLAALRINVPNKLETITEANTANMVKCTNGHIKLHADGLVMNELVDMHDQCTPIINSVHVNGTHANGAMVRNPNDVYVNGDSNQECTHGNGQAINDQSRTADPATQSYHEITIPSWNQEKEDILLGPYEYLAKQPGKDMRSQFIAGFNYWLHVPPAKLAIIERVIKMLHTASLLVDDIEDNSDLRRGIPVAHSIFGMPQTFNSGNYVYFLALQEVRKLNNSKAIDIFTEELINLHRGQGLDLFWRDSLTCPTEEGYFEMVANKTGGLFSLAIRLMQAESTTGRDFTPLVTLLGLQFQICDDYLNLMSTTYTKNKGLCEDLTEGKFSFPIIHSIRSDPQNRELINVLKQKTRDTEVKKYALNYMQRTGSFEYTRRMATNLRDKALSLIDEYEAKSWGDGTIIRTLIARMNVS